MMIEIKPLLLPAILKRKLFVCVEQIIGGGVQQNNNNNNSNNESIKVLILPMQGCVQLEIMTNQQHQQ